MAGDASATARILLEEARRLGLVRRSLEPEALHHDAIGYRTLPAPLLERIERASAGRIATIATIDFSDPRPRQENHAGQARG